MPKSLIRLVLAALFFTPLIVSAANFTVPQPSQAGDIVGLNLQNPTASTIPSRYVTFSEVFKKGAVQPSGSLIARIGGANTYVQMDIKTHNSDGSVAQAIVTFLAPALSD